MPHEPIGAKIAPSILAADFARLDEQVREAERAGADRIHVDLMEGHFVRNISMGVPIVASLRPMMQLPFETHLINPATPAAVLEEILPEIDQVLLMNVDPGFGHQPSLHTTLPKIGAVRRMIDRLNPGCDLEVDGGVAAGMKNLRASLELVNG